MRNMEIWGKIIPGIGDANEEGDGGKGLVQKCAEPGQEAIERCRWILSEAGM